MIFQRIEQSKRFRVILQLQLAEAGAKLRFGRIRRFRVLLNDRGETSQRIGVVP